MKPKRIAPPLIILLGGLLAVMLYAPGLHGSFFFDDIPSIVTAEGIRLNSLSLENLLAAWSSGQAGPSGRPIAQLSFALNYYFAGLSPFTFKACNLAIHIACSWLVYALGKRLLATAFPKTPDNINAHLAAAVLASFWLLSPIQLLPVLHVVQRMTSLSALFLLAALVFHIDAREQKRPTLLVFAWLVCWPLSFFSKESGILFPLFALAWELILHRANTNQLDRFARCFAYVVAAALIAAALYALSAQGQWLWAGYTLRNFSLCERLLTEARVIWLYLGLMALPHPETLGLYHDDIAISTSLTSPWTTLPALIGIFGLVFLAWKTRRTTPLVALGITWFFVGHLLESTVFSLEIAHEHRNYLPFLGALLPFAYYLFRAIEKGGIRRSTGIALAISVLVWLSFVTGIRAHQFGDEIRRTQTEAMHHRNSSRAQFDAGRALASVPDTASASSPAHSLAREHFKLATGLDPYSKMGLLGQIQLDCLSGLSASDETIGRLGRRLKETPFSHGDQTVLYALKELMTTPPIPKDCVSPKQIEHLFSSALANPTALPQSRAAVLSWLADYQWLNRKDLRAATIALDSSLEINPGNPSNLLKRAQLWFLSGNMKNAKRLLLDLKTARLSAREREQLNSLLSDPLLAQH